MHMVKTTLVEKQRATDPTPDNDGESQPSIADDVATVLHKVIAEFEVTNPIRRRTLSKLKTNKNTGYI